jgi:hypothetical protein
LNQKYIYQIISKKKILSRKQMIDIEK